MERVILDDFLDYVGEYDVNGGRYIEWLAAEQCFRMDDQTLLPRAAALRRQDETAIAHQSEVGDEDNQIIVVDSRHFPPGLVNFNYIHPQAHKPGARQLRQKVYSIYTNPYGVRLGYAYAAKLKLLVAQSQRGHWEVVAYEPVR